jgi:type IV secretory pathway VirB2 component (pilin)
MRTIWQNPIRLKAVSRQALAVAVGLLLAAPAFAQATGSSPWENAVNVLMTAFTSTIARGLSLVAIVVSGLTFALAKAARNESLPVCSLASAWPLPQ